MFLTSFTASESESSIRPVVSCENVVKEYRRGSSRGWRKNRNVPVVRAVDEISLNISSGSFVGIAGPSGSGKSTLLHLIAGLDLPTEGFVELCGRVTGDLSRRERAHLRLTRVGIVFQHFHLLPSLSARANVAVPLVELGIDKRTRRKRATELLNGVGLADRIDHSPGTLSGGEQQRVAIARALVTQPDVLIADEPTGEVDSTTGARLLDLFEELAKDHAVVIASHDQQALSRADRLIHLRDGRIESVDEP